MDDNKVSTENYAHLESIVPETRICPLCYKMKIKLSQWAETIVGDAVCRSCIRLFPDLSKNQIVPKIPEDCPICGRHTTLGSMRKIKMWVKTKSVYMCEDCTKTPPLVGSYRVDMRGREYRCVSLERAAFVFGVHKTPKKSFPSSLARYTEQQSRMWAIVSSHMHLCDTIASRFTTQYSQLWDDLQAAALEGLMRASVEMLWNFDSSLGRFEWYAQRSMINACKNCLKVRAREFSVREEFSYQNDLETSLQNFDDKINDDPLCGPDAARIVSELLPMFNERDVYILTRRFVDNATFEEIGIELGVLRSAIHNRWARIKATIENIMD